METLLHAIKKHVEEAIVIYDAEGCVIFWNDAFKELYGYTNTELTSGVHFKTLGEFDIKNGNVVVAHEYGSGDDYLKKKQHYREKLEGSFIVNLKDGRWIKTTDRRLPNGGFISVQTDITELKNLSNDLRLQNLELETLNGLLEQAVSTDSLTGSKSRSAIIKAVNDLFNSTQSYDEKYILLIDLDNFKAINDTFGHVIGDKVLVNFVKEMKKLLSKEETIGRLGGDEFIVLFHAKPASCTLEKLSQFRINLTETEEVTLKLSGCLYRVTGDLNNFGEIYQYMDDGLYTAKRKGKDQIVKINH